MGGSDMKPSRQAVYDKYKGKCAYSGTDLENDWQVDHLFPQRCRHFYKSDIMLKYYKVKGCHINDIENLMPSQRVINHYKRGLFIEQFRLDQSFGLMTLHKRLAKLPKSPRVERSIKRKRYMLKLASYFGITENMPFNGKFYFETSNENKITERN
jgi:hypothetical protein